MPRLNLLKEMNGEEIWTNAFGDRFGERVCVMVEYPYCWHEGRKFKPTPIEVKKLWDDRFIQEYGTSDINKIMKMEGFDTPKVNFKKPLG